MMIIMFRPCEVEDSQMDKDRPKKSDSGQANVLFVLPCEPKQERFT